MTFVVILAVAAALMIGVAWGLYLPMSDQVKGGLMAFGGGALVVSLAFELYRPAIGEAGLAAASLALLAGAAVFTGIDYLVDEHWGSESGGGLLAAITLDGVPENLALGVALIGASPGEVGALAAAIFISNLPEAAGGADNMRANGWSAGRILLIWGATAGLLAGAAIAGNLLLAGAETATLGLIRSFAAGAVVASLATEIFPQAYREGHHMTGIATGIGVVAAAALGT